MKKVKRLLTAILSTAILFPAAAVNANAADREVVVGGMPFGVTMYTSGVIVINVDDSEDSPAREAGIRENDVITKADGKTVSTNEDLKKVISESQGEDIELSLTRGKSPISLTITPEKNDDGEYEVGMWIRDSAAGLGTVTYFDESTYSFGALGHGICDRDTGLLLPLRSGKVVKAEVTSVIRAQKGVAGGLNGYMTDEALGEISVNNGYGIFGRYVTVPDGMRVMTAEDDEIRTGEAQIYCCVDDNSVKGYDIEIEKLNLGDQTGQNMVIRVTDDELIEKTGGIVQGMSGSPIIQDGKLVGAVTHVFVNAPETGYGIAISNMLESYEKYGGVGQ